jgi:hypothetical protein
MKKYTIEDLAQGRCAVINDGSLEQLREVLSNAFDWDIKYSVAKSVTYYFKHPMYDKSWQCSNGTNLPTQSVKDFLVEENEPFQYEYKWYDVREVLPDERFDGKMIGTILYGNKNKVYGYLWFNQTEAFLWPERRDPTDLIKYWCPLPDFPQ